MILRFDTASAISGHGELSLSVMVTDNAK